MNIEFNNFNWDNIFLDMAQRCFLELFKKDPSSPMHISKIAINNAYVFTEQLKEKLR